MADVVQISLGSLGCLGGGKGNFRETTSLHDSTCRCEGCVEKRFAAQEFSITTENCGERDYGFNAGDEGGPNAPADTIVLSDDDDSDDDDISSSGSSYIFEEDDEMNYHDEPSDNDTGYGDDGQDSEDAYSVFSPRPYHHHSSSEDGSSSDSDITEDDEDTPLYATVHNSASEAAKRDGERINSCIKEIDAMEHSTIQQKSLHSFIDAHHATTTIPLENKLRTMFKQMTNYIEVVQAAKRRIDYDAIEITRLRDLCMAKTEETNRKDEELYNMANNMGQLALRHHRTSDRQLESIHTLRQRLQEEQQKTHSVEEELRFTRKRLLTFTRRSVPRKCKRVRRRIESDNEDENF